MVEPFDPHDPEVESIMEGRAQAQRADVRAAAAELVEEGYMVAHQTTSHLSDPALYFVDERGDRVPVDAIFLSIALEFRDEAFRKATEAAVEQALFGEVYLTGELDVVDRDKGRRLFGPWPS